MIRISSRVTVSFRVRFRVQFTMRFKVKYIVRFWVRLRASFKVRFRIRSRVRFRVRLQNLIKITGVKKRLKICRVCYSSLETRRHISVHSCFNEIKKDIILI